MNVIRFNKRRTTTGSNIDRLFSSLLNDLKSDFDRTNSISSADIYKIDDQVHYELDVPGFTKENLDISLKDGKMIVSGERSTRRHEAAEFLNKGRNDRFRRVFPLPQGIENAETLTANLQDGVLHIVAPLAIEERDGIREVEIQ